MDIQRTVAFVVFFTSAFLLWDAWQKHQLPASGATPPTITSTPTPSQPAPGQPTAGQTGADPPSAPASPAAGQLAQSGKSLPVGTRLRVYTDRFVADIDTAGGDLRELVLVDHKAAEDKSKPLVLMRDQGSPLYVTQSGLLGEGLPTHNTVYSAAQTEYRMAAGQDTLEVRLTAPATNGVTVSKVYTFHHGSYLIDIGYRIENGGPSAISPFAYYQFLRDDEPPPGDVKMLNTFTGPTVYTDKDKFVKVSFSDIDKGAVDYSKTSTDGWLALLQHYFVAAWLPEAGATREFYTKKIGDDLYAAGVIVPAGTLQPGAAVTVNVPLYAGPQEVDQLARLAPGLDLVVDYGWLTIIAAPIFKVLKFIQGWVTNWGVAIILLTVLIKLLFYPLQNKASRSMAQMKVLAPKMQKLKEQYGDDRTKLQQAMMEMYKKEKINPLGGCLPILIQIPVFISLYWVLLASVELRHAPFALWIQDLSAADPYFILPVIYAATMFVQMRLQPASPDPVQQKVMMAMPVIFSVLFIFFPAGLVLYWIVNNVLTILQQWHINRVIEKETAAKVRR